MKPTAKIKSTMPLKPSLRTRKKEQRAQRIRDAAMNLFEEQDYESTTMEQIAERAEVSVGTLYNYHGSKPEILADSIKSLLLGVTDDVSQYLAALEGTPAERCTQMWVGAIKVMPVSKELYRELISGMFRSDDIIKRTMEELTESTRDMIEGILNQCIQDGVLDPGTNLKITSWTMMQILSGLEVSYYLGTIRDLEQLEEDTSRLMRIFFRGLEGEFK